MIHYSNPSKRFREPKGLAGFPRENGSDKLRAFPHLRRKYLHASIMKVIIRRSKLVPPSQETPKEVLWNSNVVYLYRRKKDPDNENDVFFSYEVLEAALGEGPCAILPNGRETDGE
ncbi:hypothetical protein KP509_29G086600 [Ceratopteris richardii]|uniref:Uncharacterized protein n=1 Tax=Ceratopteris richardii TaxID=49495 RepID=A0A8T2RB90_CERRI|nr:hypothetical protein KP509_29G086600 [Ceratopteris richardii]